MTRKSPELRTVAEVITAFGGAQEMRAIFGGGRSRFANFKLRGAFPDSMHMKIYVAARERGLNIAPELIGMKPVAWQGELTLQAAE
jgi:hypothetical protein